MTEPLATIRDYQQLLDALRARIDQLGITLDQVDEIGGLPSRYASKILARVKIPQRKIGMQSLGPILGVLGLKLLAVQDDEMLTRIGHRLKQRRRRKSNDAGCVMLAVKNSNRRGFSPFVASPEFARMARAKQVVTQSPEIRSKVARKAARARWRGIRPKAKKP